MDTINRAREESPAVSDTERKKKLALESVAERKSEYGMEGLLAAKHTGRKGSPILPEISDLGGGFGQDFGGSFMSETKPQQKVESSQTAEPLQSQPPKAQPPAEISQPSPPSPVHPSVQPATPEKAKAEIPQPLQTSSHSTSTEPLESKVDEVKTAETLAPETTLQHTPSLGFRSVVHQAFDQQVPPTPSSTS